MFKIELQHICNDIAQLKVEKSNDLEYFINKRLTNVLNSYVHDIDLYEQTLVSKDKLKLLRTINRR